MSVLNSPERHTQDRVLQLFQKELGYTYLGNWTERLGNGPIEPELLAANLEKRGYTQAQISRCLDGLQRVASCQGDDLYAVNEKVYSLLRYGVGVKTEASAPETTVHLVDWDHPEKNDFAIAEEVTLKGNHERRPDIVLYLNGLAVGVLELKNSRVSVGEGIRQNLSNQSREFNEGFFVAMQLILAGNDSEGLRYGTIQTPEKYFLTWKEDEHENDGSKLDKYLKKLCRKERLLELIHDFVLFDAGRKKLPRPHQYFGMKAAQEHVRRRQGGIIWHTQGAGKSILMVLLAKWILENDAKSRVVIVTDRDELDKQIESVLRKAGAVPETDEVRTTSGRDLMTKLGQVRPRLLCSLIHKFGRKDVEDFEAYLKELSEKPSVAVGDVFVFVDECHRTQNGKLHRTMKAVMPNAVFIGFTGTPLLKEDKSTSHEIFGGYIHTYKFSEAVEDGVVLDLMYEARDIDQRLSSQKHIDEWFEAKTRGLNDWQRDELKKEWGTMQHVLSSRSRMDKIVCDIVHDFGTKPRLSNQRGNALLVASSIYEACKYFELFQKTSFKGKCAVITSYDPKAGDVSKEEVGANTETDKQFVYNTYVELLKSVPAEGGKSKTEIYEDASKKLFVNEPANMKLLIVVDKLLTGFDAPPCTYLYIDKSMQDHGLFQAICRTNRLDGDDKTFGYIVDYKDLFKKVENAISVYTSELDQPEGEGTTSEVLLQDRLKKGREKLDEAIEALALLCDPVEPPKGELEHIRYFCGNVEIPTDLKECEPQRMMLYKAVVTLLRAYGALADELEAAGYSAADIVRIRKILDESLALRETIRRASGETLDLKPFEADMRHLIDTYIQADNPRQISPFEGIGLLDLIVKLGIQKALDGFMGKSKGDKEAVAETIENNVRSKIIKDQLTDPAYYETMSRLLDEIIAARRSKAIAYEEYLKQIAELVRKTNAGRSDDTPAELDTKGKLALWNRLRTRNASALGTSEPGTFERDEHLALALRIDAKFREIRPDGWRGNKAKENIIKKGLYEILGDLAEVEEFFKLFQAQTEY